MSLNMNESITWTSRYLSLDMLFLCVCLNESLNWISIVHRHALSHSIPLVAAVEFQSLTAKLKHEDKPLHFRSFLSSFMLDFNPSVFCRSSKLWVVCVTVCVPIRFSVVQWIVVDVQGSSVTFSRSTLWIKLAGPPLLASFCGLCSVCVTFLSIYLVQMSSVSEYTPLHVKIHVSFWLSFVKRAMFIKSLLRFYWL